MLVLRELGEWLGLLQGIGVVCHHQHVARAATVWTHPPYKSPHWVSRLPALLLGHSHHWNHSHPFPTHKDGNVILCSFPEECISVPGTPMEEGPHLHRGIGLITEEHVDHGGWKSLSACPPPDNQRPLTPRAEGQLQCSWGSDVSRMEKKAYQDPEHKLFWTGSIKGSIE